MEVFSGLAYVLAAAAVGGVAAKLLRQPVILGYLAAGAVTSALGLATGESVKILGQVGVTLLLFLVGLELPLPALKSLGRTAAVTGLGQIAVTSIIGWLIARLLGFSAAEAVILGIGLTFSSTIVVVKLLSEKGDLASLHGKIAVGSLLVQDFVAVGILIALAGAAQGGTNILEAVTVAGKGIGLLAVTLGLANSVMPKVAAWLAGSIELMFIFSIGWCLLVAAVVASPLVGFSVEIGGLLAGLAFANASQHGQIMARVRPLRDFFLTLFFVSLGAAVKLPTVGASLMPAIVLGSYVLVGNPLIMMFILGILGYKKRTAFLAGITMGQISEFSLIIVAAAAAAGQVRTDLVTVITIVGAVTMTVCTYVIQNGGAVYARIGKYLPFWGQGRMGEKKPAGHAGQVVLFGYGRTGKEMLPALTRLGHTVVVDFDPQVVDRLTGEGVEAVFGDAADVELYDALGLKESALVASTIPDESDTKMLLSELSAWKRRPVTVVTAVDEPAAKKLYRAGADYVLVPNRVGGQYLAHIFNHHGLDREYIRKTGSSHREGLEI